MHVLRTHQVVEDQEADRPRAHGVPQRQYTAERRGLVVTMSASLPSPSNSGFRALFLQRGSIITKIHGHTHFSSWVT